ncbi:Non-histone chromosomal protein HMG-14 [Cricetulus griseus]|uniref:Non-histone chromosomal protein HMG-14 n=1 Tax=Cricetulus griseus TaxID=10029 RepID=G3HFW8_CRIGR|nr:Non-histone chromosomal protein HMG-14 [Cricetulus griseus]
MRSRKRPRERINHQTKKVQTKGKRGAKGKQAEAADQHTADLPAENGETENQSPASEVEEKEAKSN